MLRLWNPFDWRIHATSRTLTVRGILALAFGVTAFFMPAAALFSLVLFFGAFAFVDGLVAITSAFAFSSHPRRWIMALEGVVGILAGLAAFFTPRLTAWALVTIIGLWAIFAGTLRIATAIRIAAKVRGEGLIILTGVASLLLGIALLALPLMSALITVSILGIYGIVLGIALLRAAARLRALERGVSENNERRAA